MRGVFRRLFACVAVPVVTLSLFLSQTGLSVSACDWEAHEKMMEEAARTGHEEYYDISTWVQWDNPDALATPLGDGTGGATLGDSGCSYCAASFMLYRMGLLDVYKEENYFTTLEKMNAVGGWISWGKMDYTRIGEAYPGVSCDAYKAAIPGGSLAEQEAFLQQKMDEGYFIILCIMGSVGDGGHYVFLDSITEDGDMILGDASYWAINWNGYHGPNGGYLVDYSLFRYDGATPASTESIYVKNAPEVVEIREQKRLQYIDRMMADLSQLEEDERFLMFLTEDGQIGDGARWLAASSGKSELEPESGENENH